MNMSLEIKNRRLSQDAKVASREKPQLERGNEAGQNTLGGEQ